MLKAGKSKENEQQQIISKKTKTETTSKYKMQTQEHESHIVQDHLQYPIQKPIFKKHPLVIKI